MVYLSHSPTYAISNACLRAAYGRIEIWSTIESRNERNNDIFDKKLFVIPNFYLGMFAANMEIMQDSFRASIKSDNQPGEVTPISLDFGSCGYIEGNFMKEKKHFSPRQFLKENIFEGKASSMALGEDRMFRFTHGDEIFVIENLTKLHVFAKVCVKNHRK